MKKLLVILLFSITSLFAFEKLTVDNFDEKVSGKNVVVEFYTTWWTTCKALGKSLTKYDASKTQDVTIYKVDLEEQEALGKRFSIRGFPVLLYLKDGQIITKEFGYKSVKDLEKSINKYLY